MGELARADQVLRSERTPAMLRQLAIDIDAGQVFGTWSIDTDRNNEDLVLEIWAPLKESRYYSPAAFGAMMDGIGGVYEYLARAQRPGSWGYPSFDSVQLLTIQECLRLDELLGELMRDREKFLSAGPRAA